MANYHSKSHPQWSPASRRMVRPIVRVTKRDKFMIVSIGLLAGIAVAVAGPRPTGSTPVDVALIVAAVTCVTWGSASAPWWSLSAVSGVAAVASPSGWMIALGALAFAGSVRVGLRRKAQVPDRAVIAGITLIVLARLGTDLFFGLTSLAGIAAAVALAGLGMWRRPTFEVRLLRRIVAVAAGYCLVATAAFAIVGISVRGDLSDGNSAARVGLDELKRGDFSQAQESFAKSARLFESANASLGRTWVQLARLVPVIGQHRTAANELAGGAAAASRVIDIELRKIDFDTLTVNDGQIDLDAVRALQEPLQHLQSALDRLDTAVKAANSPWLIHPIQIRIDDLSDQIAEQRSFGEKAITALDLAPAMLGADGERVYFVMFTTPAEARGQGGFMGNYAELSLNHGRIKMSAFGSNEDLTAATEPGIVISGPEDWLNSYGVFGFQSGPDQVFDSTAWGNITMSPDFPSTSQVVADLYPRSGGREIDGVINLDVFALQTLIGFVGPLNLDGVPEPLTGTNTAKFLLVDQYSITDVGARTDMLERVASETVTRLLQGSPPPPIELGQAFAPLVRSRDVMIWARDPAEQALFSDVHADAALLPDRSASMAIAVTINNAGGNKIDAFLERDYTFEETTDDSGDLIGRLTLRLRNTAPAEGLPGYIIENQIGQPNGSNRLYLTIFSSLPLGNATVDSHERTMSLGSEEGLHTYSTYVDIPAMSESTVTLESTVKLQAGTYDLITLPQPGAIDEQWHIDPNFITVVTYP